MSAPTRVNVLRGESHDSRTTDNVSAVLDPLARAVGATPIMGTMPAWTNLSPASGWTWTGAPDARPAYYLDALNEVILKGSYQNTSGGAHAAGTLIVTMPIGHRPAERRRFSAYHSGVLAAEVYVEPSGRVTIQNNIPNNGIVNLNFGYLAEQ